MKVTNIPCGIMNGQCFDVNTQKHMFLAITLVNALEVYIQNNSNYFDAFATRCKFRLELKNDLSSV